MHQTNHKQHYNNNNTFGIHRTRDGRKFITTTNSTTTNQSRIACTLCYNKHVNPWHPTENCPYKHPTHIIDKEIRERVMQHNAIYGTEKKNFNKTTDITRPGPHQPKTAAAGNIIIPTTSSDPPLHPSTTSNSPPATDTDLTRLEEGNHLSPDNEVIESDYFSYPIPAEANLGHFTSPDFTADEIISDHLQYLSYHS
jgi:hypothetical protein